MKLEPVTKLDKRNKKPSKNLTTTSCLQIVTSLSFFRFMANLEQSESRRPDAWSVKLTFSKILSYIILQKLKIELKTLQHSSHTVALSKGTVFT